MVAVVIPARYASHRLPGKALSDIAGRPMIVHVCDRARECKFVSRVIVATDDERILDSVTKHGGEAVMTSPNHMTGTERVAEVARELDDDIIVNLQGDEPLIEADAIAQVIQPFSKCADSAAHNAPSILTPAIATLKRNMTDSSEWDNPNAVKVVTDVNGRALYFSRSPIPSNTMANSKNNPANKNGPKASPKASLGELNDAFIHVGLYAFKREVLLELVKLPPGKLERAEGLEQLRWLENGYDIHVVVSQYAGRGVDTAEDLEWVRDQLKNKI